MHIWSTPTLTPRSSGTSSTAVPSGPIPSGNAAPAGPVGHRITEEVGIEKFSDAHEGHAPGAGTPDVELLRTNGVAQMVDRRQYLDGGEKK